MVSYLNKLQSPSPKGALCKVLLKLFQLFRKIFLNFVYAFLLLPYHLFLVKDMARHLNKFDSPSPQDALCQIWLKFAQWFWRRRFSYFVNTFLLFHNYHPFAKGMALHLKKL